MGTNHQKTENFRFPSTFKAKRQKMKVAILCLVLALFVAIEAAAIEAENVEKRALGCADGCQPFPNNGKTGTNACIHAYGNMFDLRRNSYGNQCCPRGCGRGRRFADEETYMKESEPAAVCEDGRKKTETWRRMMLRRKTRDGESS